MREPRPVRLYHSWFTPLSSVLLVAWIIITLLVRDERTWPTLVLCLALLYVNTFTLGTWVQRRIEGPGRDRLSTHLSDALERAELRLPKRDAEAIAAAVTESALERLNRAAHDYEKLWQMISALVIPVMLVMLGWLIGR